MTTDADQGSNAASRLAAVGEELEDARSQGDISGVERIEQAAANDIASALTSADDDLTELGVYVLSIVSPDTGTTILEAALLTAGDEESQLEIVRRAARLAGHDLRRVRGTDAQARASVAFRLPWTSGGHFEHPAQPAVTNLLSITTIVHGTIARRSGDQTGWWEPKGRFASRVGATVDDFYTHSDYYYWSGGNSDSDRRQAAADLVQWLDQRLQPQGTLCLLCHSHGGNVALLAAQSGLRIKKLFLLGTPVRTDYLPWMDHIEQIYFIFSPTDHVQTGGTFGRRRGEGRTLADTAHIRNLVTASAGASHSDLHDWSVWTDPHNRFDKLL